MHTEPLRCADARRYTSTPTINATRGRCNWGRLETSGLQWRPSAYRVQSAWSRYRLHEGRKRPQQQLIPFSNHTCTYRRWHAPCQDYWWTGCYQRSLLPPHYTAPLLPDPQSPVSHRPTPTENSSISTRTPVSTDFLYLWFWSLPSDPQFASVAEQPACGPCQGDARKCINWPETTFILPTSNGQFPGSSKRPVPFLFIIRRAEAPRLVTHSQSRPWWQMLAGKGREAGGKSFRVGLAPKRAALTQATRVCTRVFLWKCPTCLNTMDVAKTF